MVRYPYRLVCHLYAGVHIYIRMCSAHPSAYTNSNKCFHIAMHDILILTVISEGILSIILQM